MRCPTCSFENPGDARYCQQCGQPLETRCPHCSASNAPDARFCKQCGTRLASPPGTTFPDQLTALRKSAPAALQDKVRAAAAHLEGERKPVTILFTDIVGSTPLAEKFDPEEWKEIVVGAHRCVSQAVYRYEGTIAQLLGDGVLAFFGAPITHEDDPIRAVRAGLDVQKTIADYAQSLAGYVDKFQMRVGIHTGTVVVGNIGSDLHMEYLAIGDSVNLAARLQSACPPGQVLLSDATAKRVHAAFDLEDQGEITVKGKAEPVHVFVAKQSKSSPSRSRGIVELSSPLVGRQSEMAVLHAALNALFDGHGQIVCVTGEAGIGKTRLVDECRQTFTTLHWLEGRSLSYGQTLSFWAINQLLKSDLRLSDADPEPRVRAALHRRLEKIDGEHDDELYPYLAHLLGIRLEGEAAERLRALDGETLKRQILLSLATYINRVAQSCPTVLVFDDLHWADPSTLDALEHLLPLTDRAAVMLLLLFRSERDKGCWRLRETAARDYPHRHTGIELSPLSPDLSNELVDHLLAIADLPETTRRLILDRSEGNPLYVEEIVRSLIDQGALVREGERWHGTAQIDSISIPDTLQGLLLARIDRLEEEERRTLQLASVIGKSFLYRLLQSIAETERQLDEHLAHLQRVDLVREKTRRPELEYIFRHTLTQQATYDSLLLEQRRDFHRRVGLALEQLFQDRREEYVGLLAHHFDRAGDSVRAVDYLIRAGDKLRLEEAQEEALSCYRRAVELLNELGDDERAARTYLKLGLVYHTNFDFESAHRAHEMAFSLQKRTRPSAYKAPDHPPVVLHTHLPVIRDLDPGSLYWQEDCYVMAQVFAGLAQIDEEQNLIPYVARSWEILEGGTRYLFHLRDDVRWTDGTAVTAKDFEWAWKRNLRLDSSSPYRSMMDDIVGARDYREGKNADPDSVQVRALDPLTLEVRLTSPVAYMLYLTMTPIAFPLPRGTIERWGPEWWKPEHIVSNGPFKLNALDTRSRVHLQRNPDFFGEVHGNLDEVEFHIAPHGRERVQEYLDNKLDLLLARSQLVSPDIPASQCHETSLIATYYIMFAPSRVPTDDVRVRRALMLALDRDRIARIYASEKAHGAMGGMIPPELPGHSPDLAITPDLAQARRLLAQAGYPEGRGMPTLQVWAPGVVADLAMEIPRQWKEGLGVESSLDSTSDQEDGRFKGRFHALILGWHADYPDPANFMQQSSIYSSLCEKGWRDTRYEQLIADAARTIDRTRRMAMYREADRLLVREHSFVLPITYGGIGYTGLAKPWITNVKWTLLGIQLSEIIKQPREDTAAPS